MNGKIEYFGLDLMPTKRMLHEADLFTLDLALALRSFKIDLGVIDSEGDMKYKKFKKRIEELESIVTAIVDALEGETRFTSVPILERINRVKRDIQRRDREIEDYNDAINSKDDQIRDIANVLNLLIDWFGLEVERVEEIPAHDRIVEKPAGQDRREKVKAE